MYLSSVKNTHYNRLNGVGSSELTSAPALVISGISGNGFFGGP